MKRRNTHMHGNGTVFVTNLTKARSLRSVDLNTKFCLFLLLLFSQGQIIGSR